MLQLEVGRVKTKSHIMLKTQTKGLCESLFYLHAFLHLLHLQYLTIHLSNIRQNTCK